MINKFRGDAGLLDSAISYTYDYIGKPTLGIIPMIENLGVPDEDSVSFKSVLETSNKDKPNAAITIGLVDLPHISNFTDIDPLEGEPDVHVKVIRRAEELQGCDAVILPGSKNVFADLDYLNSSGIASRIIAMADDCDIIGICGGYQMLGRTLSDPSGIESSEGSASGLGLLNLETVLGDDKILEQITAKHVPTGSDLSGYEIHHGRTISHNAEPWIEGSDGKLIGVSHSRLNIHGTYLHGLFDADCFRRWYIDSIRVHRGKEPLGEVVYVHDIEASIDRLAGIVREHIDMDGIYSIMGL